MIQDNTEYAIKLIRKERDELRAKTTSDSILICRMRDTISMLAVPANQRMTKVNKLIDNGDFENAKKHEIQKNN